MRRVLEAITVATVAVPVLSPLAGEDATASRSFGPPVGTRTDYAFKTDPAASTTMAKEQRATNLCMRSGNYTW